MRKILFKGKRVDNGDWIEGIPIKTHIGTFIVFEENPHYCIQYGYMEIDGLCKVDENTVCQYTGLTDKNGKKIWDGDIVRSDDGKVGQVQWFEEHCAFMIWNITDNKVHFLFDNDFSKIEVIGNIFDNPDLLTTSSTDSDQEGAGLKKAILVIDMPKACEECPLSLETEKANTNICRGCEKYSFNPDSNRKPDWCPLKEMPNGHDYLSADLDQEGAGVNGKIDRKRIV